MPPYRLYEIRLKTHARVYNMFSNVNRFCLKEKVKNMKLNNKYAFVILRNIMIRASTRFFSKIDTFRGAL